MKIAPPSSSIARVVIAIALFIGAMVGMYALLSYINPLRMPAAPSSSFDETTTVTVPKPSEVSGDELAKLSTAQRVAFCKEFPTKTTTPIDSSNYLAMGITEEQYLSFVLFCRMATQSDDFLVKDKSGENDAKYRENAQKYKDLAAVATFDLYDTSYTAQDIQMTTR